MTRDPGAPRYVSVAVPIPLRRELTYRVPDDWSEPLAAGDRVRVPLGSRQLVATVVEIDAADRYQSWPEVVEAINDVIEGRAGAAPIPIPQTVKPPQSKKQRQRRDSFLSVFAKNWFCITPSTKMKETGPQIRVRRTTPAQCMGQRG